MGQRGIADAATFMLNLSRSTFVRNVAATFGTRVLTLGLGLITGVIIARALGPVGRGNYYFAITVGGLLAQFGNFGLHAANTHFVAKRRDLLPILVGNSLAVTSAFTVVIVSLGIGLVMIRPGALPFGPAMFVLVVCFVTLSVAYLLMQNLALGLDQIRNYNIVEIGQSLLALLLLGIVIVIGPVTPVAVFAAGVGAMAVSTLWAFKKVLRLLPQRPLLRVSILRETFGFGLKAYLAAFAMYFVIRSDILVVDYLLGARATGIYSIAASLVDKLQMLPIAIGTLLFPRLSAIDDRDSQWSFARRAAVWTFVLVLASSVVGAVGARPAIGFLFGAAYLPSVAPLYLLLPGFVALSTNIVFMNYFASIGMPWFVVVSPALAAALNLLLNMLLVPGHGINAAAFASSVAYILMLLMSLAYIRLILRQRILR